MGFFAVLAASLFAVFLFTVFGGYSVWTFLKMDDKITALQKRVEELEATQKTAEKSKK